MLLTVLSLLREFLVIVIIANVIMSWVPQLRSHPVGRFIHLWGEMVLSPFRKILPPISLGGGGLDLSPLIAIIVIDLVFRFLVAQLAGMGM